MMKNLNIYLYFIPHVIFIQFCACIYFFLHVLHLDVLRGQFDIETESKNIMYGYNADHPWQSLYYTLLPYCVISSFHGHACARFTSSDTCIRDVPGALAG